MTNSVERFSFSTLAVTNSSDFIILRILQLDYIESIEKKYRYNISIMPKLRALYLSSKSKPSNSD
jgi:hypothetical protein